MKPNYYTIHQPPPPKKKKKVCNEDIYITILINTAYNV